MYPFSLVPDEFEVPEILETERLRLRPLTIHDVVKDFAAVMESEERLRVGFEPDNDWPSGLTLEQDLIDLGWHQREFQERSSFAFTVVDLDVLNVGEQTPADLFKGNVLMTIVGGTVVYKK